MSGRPRDCEDLGLSDDQYAALTGFTHRAFAALAHLRECWCSADPNNRAAVVASIRALLQGHSMARYPRMCATVLKYGLDDRLGEDLLDEIGLDVNRAIDRGWTS